MAANTLTLTADAVADIVRTFVVSDDMLRDRVSLVGALAAEHKVSGNAIYDALVAPYDVRPVGLSLATVQNALAAHVLASLHLSAEIRADYYAEILTGIHAVRVKPLREMWGKLIADRGATADADRAALIAESIAAVIDAREKPAEKPEDEKPEDAPEDAPEDEKPEDAEPVLAPLADRALAALVSLAGMVAECDSAELAAELAARTAELAALAAERAAELAPATPATARARRATASK